MGAEILSLPLGEVAENNIRQAYDPEKARQLAASVKARGVLQPVLVRSFSREPGQAARFELVDGHRRLRAARAAGLKSIPAILVEPSSADPAGKERVRLLRQGAVNLEREDFTPLEQGQLFEALIAAGVTLEVILREYGFSKTYVNDRRRLARMPEKVLALVKAGELTITHAQALVGLPAERQVELAVEAAKEGQSPQDMREEVGRGGAYHPLPPAKQLVGAFAACASCEKRIEGCRRKQWDGNCPYNDSGFGPAMADCQHKGKNCDAVTLCPDRKCLLGKVASMIKAYREKHPEAKAWKQRAFGEARSYLDNAGAYAGGSKWCRACKLAVRKLAPSFAGIKIESSCREYNCPGREGKNPDKEQQRISRENASRAAANSPKARAAAAKREAMKQALCAELKKQLAAAAIAALKRPVSVEDRKRLARYLCPRYDMKPWTATYLRHVGDLARLKGDDLVRAGAILARLQSLSPYWAGPKQISNLIRELGGKIKTPKAAPAPKKGG
jgi:ParB/RepB/Spo0J family partition protein